MLLKIDSNFNGKRLDLFLSFSLNLPISKVNSLFRSKVFFINSIKKTTSYKLNLNDVVFISDTVFIKNTIFSKINYNKITVKNIPESIINLIKNSIIFENELIIVINKPYGIACQDGNKVKYCIQNFFQYIAIEKLHIVHRIDQFTSGLLVLAKNRETAKMISEKFANHKIYKEYHAFVSPIPKNLSLTLNNDIMLKNEKNNILKSLTAQTYYETLKINEKENIALLRIIPKTGRKHQIRIHLREIGSSIIGDKKYFGNTNLSKKLQLFATRIKISDELDFSIDIRTHDHNLMSKFINCS